MSAVSEIDRVSLVPIYLSARDLGKIGPCVSNFGPANSAVIYLSAHRIPPRRGSGVSSVTRILRTSTGHGDSGKSRRFFYLRHCEDRAWHHVDVRFVQREPHLEIRFHARQSGQQHCCAGFSAGQNQFTGTGVAEEDRCRANGNDQPVS